MGVVVRLRIELADAPGALARVATVIADHGGNIISVDVLEGTDERAVDEVTVQFADRVDLAEVRRKIAEVGSARVVSHQTATSEDLVVRVLRRVTDALASDPFDRNEALRRAAADLCSTPAVWVLPPHEALAYPVGRMALDQRGSAVVVRTVAGLPPLGEAIPGEASLLAVADRHRVLLVARQLALGFTPTESARVEALVGFFDHLAAVRAMVPVPETS